MLDARDFQQAQGAMGSGARTAAPAPAVEALGFRQLSEGLDNTISEAIKHRQILRSLLLFLRGQEEGAEEKGGERKPPASGWVPRMYDEVGQIHETIVQSGTILAQIITELSPEGI